MRIQNKLFLSFLVTSLCLVLAMFVLMRWSIDKGMLEYVNTRETETLQPVLDKLGVLYEHHGSWDTLRHRRRIFHELLSTSASSQTAIDDRPPPPRHRNDQRPFNPLTREKEHRPPPPPRRTPPLKASILDINKQLVFGRYDDKRPYNLLAITHNDVTVGWLARPKRKALTEGFELSFIKQQNETLGFISIIIFVLSALVSLPLARHFVKPIKQLGMAIHHLSQGRYQHKETALNLSQRRDELGELARDIKELASTLDNNDTIRKRWLADTSHELRTPLAILRGEIEAMIDKIRPTNSENIQSLFQEVTQLQTLVEDLHELNNADIGGLRYRKETFNLVDLIEEQCNNHQHNINSAGLSLTTDFKQADITCHADPSRLTQLLDNLLNNSKKYSHSGGQILVTLNKTASDLLLIIEDSKPAVPDDALPQLFDHLYRVDSSRNRKSGGSGLGLAICKRIVEAHNGTIIAEHSSLGGLKITIRLPLSHS